MQRRLCAAILLFQAVVLGLSTPVLIAIAEVPSTSAMWMGIGLGAACVVTAGLLRLKAGFFLGWVLQVLTLSLGALLPSMFVLGVIFTALWATAALMGARIDVDRANWVYAQIARDGDA